MKTATFVIAAAMSVSVVAFAQSAHGPATAPTNSPGVSSPDRTDSRTDAGGVIYPPSNGKSSGNTGPVSLTTPTRPLVSGPNPPSLPPSATGADPSSGRSGTNQ
jgi:hypothetical protein